MIPRVETLADLLLLVGRSFVTQTGGYFVLVGALFAVFWVWGEARLAGHKLQKQRRVDGRQVRRELTNTLAALLVGTLNAGAVIAVVSSGHSRFTTDLAAAGGVAGVAASLVGLVLFNDLWFYGWHRLLHTPWWFRHVHSVHHKSVDVNPFSSYSFHAFEAFILSAWFIPAAVLVPLYLPAVGALQLFGMVNNLMSHLGYELLPRWWIKVPGLNLSNTSTYHNLHHLQLNGNYGLHTRIWDRVFGTEVPGYERAFVARDAAAAAADRGAAG
jgi:sterol desaturase/sphingolipid hydroxylase (fatty acid hydroxylase superfamily)